jgi:hypothetical protein
MLPSTCHEVVVRLFSEGGSPVMPELWFGKHEAEKNSWIFRLSIGNINGTIRITLVQEVYEGVVILSGRNILIYGGICCD